MNVAQRGSEGLRISGVQVPLHGSDRASELCGDLAHSQVGVSMPPIPLPQEGDLWNVNPSPCRSRAPTTRPAHSPAWPACSTTSIPHTRGGGAQRHAGAPDHRCEKEATRLDADRKLGEHRGRLLPRGLGYGHGKGGEADLHRNVAREQRPCGDAGSRECRPNVLGVRAAIPKELQSVTASNPGRRIDHRHLAAGHQSGTIQSRVRRLLGDFIEQTSNA